MDHASASFASPWAAAVLGGHAMGTTNTEHGFGHHGLSMDLHGYSYYRCEDKNIHVLSCFSHETRLTASNKISSVEWFMRCGVFCATWEAEQIIPIHLREFHSDFKILFTISRSPFCCFHLNKKQTRRICMPTCRDHFHNNYRPSHC